MTESLQGLLEQATPEKPLLWLDGHGYAARLFANNTPPWLNSTDCIAWLRKANGLLKPAIPSLPAGEVIRAYVGAQASLRSEMAAKSRLVYPARTLLADVGLQSLLAELASGLVSISADAPVCITLPTPLAMAELAYELAHGQTAEFGLDEADSCAAYMADSLRCLADSGIAALLLEESPGLPSQSAAGLDAYQALVNVARHYRWALGLDLGPTRWEGEWPQALDFLLSTQPLTGSPAGLWLDDAIWQQAAAPPDTTFLALRIPPDAQPEAVLERLAMIRRQAA